jgi:hypothetical protein
VRKFRRGALAGEAIVRRSTGPSYPKRLIYCETTGAGGNLTVASVEWRSQAGTVGRVASRLGGDTVYQALTVMDSAGSASPELTPPGPWNNEELEKHPEPSSLDGKGATE